MENANDFAKITDFRERQSQDSNQDCLCPEPTMRKPHENLEESWQEELMPFIELFKEGSQKTRHVS